MALNNKNTLLASAMLIEDGQQGQEDTKSNPLDTDNRKGKAAIFNLQTQMEGTW